MPGVSCFNYPGERSSFFLVNRYDLQGPIRMGIVVLRVRLGFNLEA
jgi:hypothetical protein